MDDESDLNDSTEYALPAGAEHLPPAFVNVIHFVERRVIRLYRRDADVGDRRWCPEWWRHAEAVHRMVAVWRAYECLRRSEDGLAMDRWWQVLDRHMDKLLAANGPFERCSIRGGHRDGNKEGNPHDGLAPMPIVAANAAAFAGLTGFDDETDDSDAA